MQVVLFWTGVFVWSRVAVFRSDDEVSRDHVLVVLQVCCTGLGERERCVDLWFDPGVGLYKTGVLWAGR